MVMSFKDILAKKEIKPNIKIKINEYKKSLKNNFLSSDWINSCLKNEEFLNYNLEKLNIKEISFFNKNKFKKENEFMLECRKFYKENCIPEFFKIYSNSENISSFFENYKDFLFEETSRNADIARLLLNEMALNLKENISFEIQPFDNNSFLPNFKFKVLSEENNFVIEINKENKVIILHDCLKNEYNDYFEKRNKSKELRKLYLKKEECKNLEKNKKNTIFIRRQFIPYTEFYLKESKNNFSIKCYANEIVCNDKKAFAIFGNQILIHDLL